MNIVSVIVAVFALTPPAPPVAGPAKGRRVNDGSYCGLYCVHSAATMLNARSDFTGLLSGPYLSSPLGSTAGDLALAARSVGLSAEVRGGFAAAHLRGARSPVILHVRTTGSGTAYAHWVLFLGMKGNQVLLYDPPRSHATVPIDELLALWDGTGVVLSNGEASDGLFLGAAVEVLLSLLVAVGFTIALGRVLRSPVRAILVGSLLSAGAWQLLPGGAGLCWDRRGADLLASLFLPMQAPVIAYEEVAAVVERGGATIVDARIDSDYSAGHIPGAVNIPVTTSYFTLPGRLAEAPADRPVIVYCLSEHCSWSDDVASRLLYAGRREVYVYRGGYSEWSARRGRE